MPTYDYACQDCGYEFEAFQSMKDDPLTECPSCHHSTVKRQFGKGAGIIFKGSGFYVNDSKKSAEPAKPETKSEPKS